MRSIRQTLEVHPLTSAIIGLIGMTLMGWVVTSFDVSATAYRYGASLLLGAALVALGWARPAGIASFGADSVRLWGLATLPLVIAFGMNSTHTILNLDDLSFSVESVLSWCSDNLAIGLYEEILMRAGVFYLLYRTWGQSRRGIVLAGVVQALLFGALHYLNLLERIDVDLSWGSFAVDVTPGASLLSVTVQAILAAAAGIAFAGLMAYSRTVWPCVMLHALIDAASSTRDYFGPDASGDREPTHEIEALTPDIAVMMTLFGVVFVLPGLWFLWKAEPHPEVGISSGQDRSESPSSS